MSGAASREGPAQLQCQPWRRAVFLQRRHYHSSSRRHSNVTRQDGGWWGSCRRCRQRTSQRRRAHPYIRPSCQCPVCVVICRRCVDNSGWDVDGGLSRVAHFSWMFHFLLICFFVVYLTAAHLVHIMCVTYCPGSHTVLGHMLSWVICCPGSYAVLGNILPDIYCPCSHCSAVVCRCGSCVLRSSTDPLAYLRATSRGFCFCVHLCCVLCPFTLCVVSLYAVCCVHLHWVLCPLTLCVVSLYTMSVVSPCTVPVV